ncbi:aquaporin Z [Roseovarius litorisediminis]|uniref:Aquaporin Z n=1 Tax=Roseovarius litorisediminis TaxID=1312363 RepID=A0A1Y5S098_9RHOB|nr:hypothetical protein [Roseovarius litorisediminis]SLN29764.1 aquaporin Z [Roseovarius litorisediminis]
MGQNGWGQGYLGEYSIAAAFVFELVATFLFVVVILGSIFAGGHAISQVWLFVTAPVTGGLTAGLLFKSGMLDGTAE